jgi:hypothetical protein
LQLLLLPFADLHGGGNGPSAAQLPLAAMAAVNGMPPIKMAQNKPLNNGVIRLRMERRPCSIQGLVVSSLPRMTSTPDFLGATGALATRVWGAVRPVD